MYPYEFIKDTGIDLYVVLIIVGIAAALFTARIISAKFDISARLFNFTIIVGVVAIIGGWGAARLFQAYFNYLASGDFAFTGQTFYGGLIGGAATFLIVYFIGGHFVFKDKEHIRCFGEIVDLAAPCIVIAHAFGRLGCLTAGCCYGPVTDKWYGINMLSGGYWAKRVPTQLIEALFLFAFFAVLVALIYKKRFRDTAAVYLVTYGVWRFFFEYLRADGERGSSGIAFLTPSQLIAILLVLTGVAWYFVYKYFLKERMKNVGKVKE